MTSSDPKPNGPPAPGLPKGGMSRRFAWFAFAIVAAVGLYTAGWFYAASQLESEVANAIAKSRARGAETDCTHAQARGYPFRIGLFCDGVAWSDRQAGLSLTGMGLRSAAQIYQPRRVVGELDTLRAEFTNGEGIRIDLADIRYSAHLASPLPEIASISGQTATAGALSGEALATAKGVEVHMRPNGPDLDLAGRFLGLAMIAGVGPAVPSLDGDIDLTVRDGVAQIMAPKGLRGLSTEIRNLSLNGGGAGVTVSGRFAIDAAGLVDATLTLSIRNPTVLAAILGTALPEMRPQLAQAEALIGAMGDNPQLPLAISKGRIRMGFFTLGRIPPLG
jgi:hypothetical protein